MAENKRYEVVEVATQTGLAVKDNVSGENLDTTLLLVQIANDIEEIKQGVVGK